MLLLHLSDIHFKYDDVRTPLDPNLSLRNELYLDAVRSCQRLGQVPAAILVSGDVAFAGRKEEYVFAKEWLEKLAIGCGTTLKSVFVIPGNHDVDRNKASSELVNSLHRRIKAASPTETDVCLRKILLEPEAALALYSPLSMFNVFAFHFFCDTLAPHRTLAKRDLVLNDGSTLRLVGMNSALVSSKDDQPNDLFVDPACLQLEREHGVEHLVLCHHPFSWLRQGHKLKSHLNRTAKIQLFGHEHRVQIERHKEYLLVSAGAMHPDSTEPEWEPGYNLIEVSVSNEGGERFLQTRTHVRVWQKDPAQFCARMTGMADYFDHKIALESWTPPSLPERLEQEAATGVVEEGQLASLVVDNAGRDPMDPLRNIGIDFFKLTLSQKTEVAGSLGLVEDEDQDQPDFERFRRVFLRARDRGLVQNLADKIKELSD